MRLSSIKDNESSIAEAFNSYFCNVGMDLANKLPDLNKDYKSFLPNSLPNTFVCNDISLLELNTAISSLYNKKSCGPDMVSSYLIKLSKDIIIHPLLHILNLSFSQGIFPD